MPKKNPYEQYCPIAQTLDVVGDRWSLLIVRELFLGRARYGEVAKALRPISTDVLAKRLRELEASNIIDRDADGRYGLTTSGRELAPVLRAMGRWGRSRLGLPTAPDERNAATALQMLVITSIGTDLAPPRVIEVQADGQVFAITAGANGLVAHRDAALEPDATLTTDGATLWAVGLGQISTDEAAASGVWHIDGDPAATDVLFVGTGSTSG